MSDQDVDLPRVRKRLGILLIAVALVLGGFGAWSMATKDVQGGRHEVGAMILGVGAIAAIAALVLLGFRRRRV